MAQDFVLLSVGLNGGLPPVDEVAALLKTQAVVKVSDMDSALAALQAHKPAFNVLLVDLGLHGDDALAQVHRLRQAAGGICTVVVGHINDLQFYRALKTLGVHEYFTQSATPVELASALAQRQSIEPVVAQPAQPGKIIGFICAASGDGASTIALNTAYAIAAECQLKTVLLDLDYQFGTHARNLDLHAQFGTRELFEYPERGIDANIVAKTLSTYNDTLQVIAAPTPLCMLPAIPPETVRMLVDVLRARFECVVMDIPHTWTPWTAEALRMCDEIIVVSQLWLRSLTHFSRMLTAWQEARIDINKVALAANRSGARFRETITSQDFERICAQPIRYYFANDTRTLANAENNGKTVMEVGNSQLERQIRELAKSLFGMQDAGGERASVGGKIRQLLKK